MNTNHSSGSKRILWIAGAFLLLVIVVGFIYFLRSPLSPYSPGAAAATATPAGEGESFLAGEQITVMAAASLTEPFQKLGTLYEEKYPGATAEFNFAGSQSLAQQLTSGAAGDIFASANLKYMDEIVKADLIDQEGVSLFACNRLIAIYPADNPAGIETLADLAKPGVTIILAAAEVPVGGYTQEFLQKASQDSTFDPGYKDAVLANVVSYEDNVKSVVNKVVLGEADAGIVYASDAGGTVAEKVGIIEIPDELNVLAQYPVGILSGSTHPEAAQAFLDLLLSDEGSAVLRDYGFRECK